MLFTLNFDNEKFHGDVLFINKYCKASMFPASFDMFFKSIELPKTAVPVNIEERFKSGSSSMALIKSGRETVCEEFS